MKILIAVSSKKYSKPTLSVGMNVARAFKASTTIVDVGKRINEFSMKDVVMAQERVENWNIDRPGVDVLEWAFGYLAKNNFIEKNDIEAGFPKNTLVDTGSNRSEVYLKGTVCDNVNLIIRNGNVIDELKDEVQKFFYDVTIIGGSQRGNMAHDLIQYIDSSIFVVNNFDLNKKYKILIAVNDSPNNRKAIKYGVRIAQAFGASVEAITVSETDHFGEGYKKAVKWCKKLLRRSNISFNHKFLTGDASSVINKEASDNRIIVMGSSTKNPILKFIAGSKPLEVMKNCNCPILIVK
ncbi:MAG: universal stress protein [Candidatus Neomarinimicrobiota bacterium]|nr:universal stress protein [Candidatus Neomarinimicrobiota bacterium]